MDDATACLRKQFQALEEQQKQRFKRRKAERCNATTSAGFIQPRPYHPREEDDLQLQTASNLEVGVDQEPSRQDRGAAVREIEFLRNEVQRLQVEGSQMRELLKTKDEALSKLQAVREEEKVAFGGSSSTATQRIVELSKRNREITAELTSERHRVRQLEKKLKEVVQSSEQKAKSDRECKEKPPQTPSTVAEEPTAITKLEEQLAHGKQKATEYRNQCQLLKQDLKLAHRMLAKEVGEGVSVSALLSGVSGWRGRAQQIISLQNKVTELKQQLQAFKQPGRDLRMERADVLGGRIEARQKATLEKLEKDRTKNLEEVRLELEKVRGEYANVQQQCSALKARNKLLSTDVKSLKTQLQAKAPEEGLQQTQVPDRTSGLQLVSRHKPTSREMTTSWEEERRLRQDNKHLKSQLAKCRLEIKSLKEATRDEGTLSATISRSSNRTGTFESYPSSVSLPPIGRPPVGRRAPPTNREPSLVRTPVSAGQSYSHQSRWDPEAQVTEVERDRLMQLTAALQQQLDASTDRMVRMETNVRNQRQHIARLEKQLGRRQQKQEDGIKQQSDSSDLQLESQLALQLNENAVLRETLELTRQEKMEDIKVFHSMLQEAKQLFISSVRKMQSSRDPT